MNHYETASSQFPLLHPLNSNFIEQRSANSSAVFPRKVSDGNKLMQRRQRLSHLSHLSDVTAVSSNWPGGECLRALPVCEQVRHT